MVKTENYYSDEIPNQVKGYQFTINHKEVFPGSTMVQHFHEEIEFLCVKSGRMVLTIEDEELILSEGEAVLIPPNLSHWANSLDGVSCIYDTICFNVLLFEGKGYRRFVQPLLFRSKSYILVLSARVSWQREALQILDKLIQFRKKPNVELWQLEFDGFIFILWNMIYNNQYVNITTIQSYQKLYNRMLAAVDFIHEHYDEEITTEALAKQVHLSVGTFCRYFKKLHGVTPTNYLNKYRISKSRVLLINTDRKISDIAFQCGYNNLSHFNRDFKTYMRCTPSGYRKLEYSS